MYGEMLRAGIRLSLVRWIEGWNERFMGRLLRSGPRLVITLSPRCPGMRHACPPWGR
jgi:hypothetical protein